MIRVIGTPELVDWLVPRQAAPTGAAANVSAITQELLTRLAALQEAAA